MHDSVDAAPYRNEPSAEHAGPEPGATAPPWLLLIHHLPPKPDYIRVKVRRRLDRLGALAIKNSVYVLPHRPETLEDFQWLAREIVADGGEATICASAFLFGTDDGELVASFREARARDYTAIARTAGELERNDAAAELARLERRFTAIAEIDHFRSPVGDDAAIALKAAESRIRGVSDNALEVGNDSRKEHGRTWVTRTGVFVDRIASAWLIRRFIDSEASFAFTSERHYRPRPGELRFDMFEAEFTHEGDRCTFETLISRFGLTDTALDAIAEIVHDIDVKDEKFSRPETPGVAMVLQGIAAMTSVDATRLERGAALFDGLYATFRTATASTGQ